MRLEKRVLSFLWKLVRDEISFISEGSAFQASGPAMEKALSVIYRMAQNFGTIILYALTLPNINRFSKLFHYQNQEKICNNTVTKHPTTPQVCRYTTLWNVKCLKSNNWKQEDFCNNTATPLSSGAISGVAGLSASSSSKANILNICCKNCRMTVTLDNNWGNKHVVSCC